MEHIHTAMQKAREQRGTTWLSEPAASSSARAVADAPWPTLPVRQLDIELMSRSRIVTMRRQDPSHAAFDIMRTRVLQALQRNNWTSIAITSPTPGCGKTMVCLNLAFSLANRKDCRVVLVDLDLRRPQVARLLGLDNPPLMENLLRGQLDIAEAFVRCGDNIAIAANARPVRLAAELLQGPETARVVKGIKQRLMPDVILYDLPPMLTNDDVMAFLPNVDSAILVAAAEATTVNETDICEHELSQKTNVLGVVLNKCRYTPDKYGY